MENENPTPHTPGVELEHTSRRASLVPATTRAGQRTFTEVETGIVMVWVAGELHIRCAAWGWAK